MRILSIDTDRGEVDFYIRCMEDGHKVKSFIKKDPISINIGVGILDKVEDWKNWVDWCDMIFLGDNNALMPQMDILRKRGIKVFGATEKSAKWELDREIGQDIFIKCNIDTIPEKSFHNYDEAIEYVKKTPEKLVVKVCGGDDKSLSYVSKSPEDMIFTLQRWKKLYPGKPNMIIQKFIKGVEFAVGGWFGPSGFNKGWLENFEFKKLMNGEVGVNTGEMGTVIKYVKESKLANEMLVPLVDELKKSGHSGYIDVAVIIDEDGKPWPLEFTMRPGYPTLNIQQELHKNDKADWMLDLLEGTDADNIEYNKIAVGVAVAIPDFPYWVEDPKKSVGIPIYGVDLPLESCYHPCQVQKGKAPFKTENNKFIDKECLVTGGCYVLTCTGTGSTVKDATEYAYDALDKINIPGGMLYRTDIGERLKHQLPKLHKFGYALGFDYE